MKITLKQAGKIAENYNLGKIRKMNLINGGLMNYNYDVKTDVGDFIVRILGHKFNEDKKKHVALEFKLLKYLKDNNFPYKVPEPLKNKDGKIISMIGGRRFWVYAKIEGEKLRKKDLDIKDFAKALATFHKFSRKVKATGFKKKYSHNWLLGEYKKMRKAKIRDRTDRLMIKNLDFYEECVNRFNRKYRDNFMVIHSDYHMSNLLFKDKKVFAFLDFDNVSYSPRVKEISYAIKHSCIEHGKLNRKKMHDFLNEYEKYIKLDKEEKEFILPALVLNTAIVFWWIYAGMKKAPHKRYSFLKWNIDVARAIMKELG